MKKSVASMAHRADD